MANASGKKKGGNKHNRIDRKTRKYLRSKPAPKPGRCGSSYCSKLTGCEPWK